MRRVSQGRRAAIWVEVTRASLQAAGCGSGLLPQDTLQVDPGVQYLTRPNGNMRGNPAPGLPMRYICCLLNTITTPPGMWGKRHAAVSRQVQALRYTRSPDRC